MLITMKYTFSMYMQFMLVYKKCEQKQLQIKESELTIIITS